MITFLIKFEVLCTRYTLIFQLFHLILVGGARIIQLYSLSLEATMKINIVLAT